MSAERIGNMKKFRKRKIWISSLLALSLLINVLSASAEEIGNDSESVALPRKHKLKIT